MNSYADFCNDVNPYLAKKCTQYALYPQYELNGDLRLVLNDSGKMYLEYVLYKHERENAKPYQPISLRYAMWALTHYLDTHSFNLDSDNTLRISLGVYSWFVAYEYAFDSFKTYGYTIASKDK